MRVVNKQDWSRYETPATVEEGYDADPLPPTPFVDRWEPTKTPWRRIFLMIVAVDMLMHLVASAWR